MSYKFHSDCVSWPHGQRTLRAIIDNARSITRRTFLQHVDRAQLSDIEANLGFAKHPRQGLTMAADWAVTYHRSRLRGKTVYYFRSSAIEFIFTRT